jgi:hypothetical protein
MKGIQTISFLFPLAARVGAVDLTVDLIDWIAHLPADFLGFGVEMDSWLDGVSEQKWADPVFRTAASHLAPYKLRVGGITGDWVRYVGFPNGTTSASATSGLRGWPSQEKDFTPMHWLELREFAHVTGAQVVFMLNELHGRDCQNDEQRCSGEWDTTNLATFLQAIRGDYGNWLAGFELGNELTATSYKTGEHLTNQETIDDMSELSKVVQSIFPSPPVLAAPSTDFCRDGQPEQYLQGTKEVLNAYSFHSYPGTDGTGMPEKLLDLTWLKTGLLESDAHANVGACVSAAAYHNKTAYLTESNSMYAWQDCSSQVGTIGISCLMKGFTNGFWYVASLGQFAEKGVQLHTRWCLSEYVGSPFPTIFRDPTSRDITVATDYWVAVLHKRLMGSRVLKATLSDENAGLVYASCTAGVSGGVTIMYANPSSNTLTLSPPGGWSSHELYALTGEGSMIRLNGDPLELTAEGGLPPMHPPSFKGNVQLPPLSYGFVVFKVGVSVCASPSPGPAPSPVPGTAPSSCPGGSFGACTKLCPSDLKSECVQVCGQRCQMDTII